MVRQDLYGLAGLVALVVLVLTGHVAGEAVVTYLGGFALARPAKV